MNKYKYQKNRGFAALLIVVIISVSALIMVKNSAYLSLGELDLGFMFSKKGQALSVVDGCMESTLSQIKEDPNYGLSGTINLATLGGFCTIEISDTLDDRTISVVGGVENYYRNIESNITISAGNIIVNSWEEKSI